MIHIHLSCFYCTEKRDASSIVALKMDAPVNGEGEERKRELKRKSEAPTITSRSDDHLSDVDRRNASNPAKRSTICREDIENGIRRDERCLTTTFFLSTIFSLSLSFSFPISLVITGW